MFLKQVFLKILLCSQEKTCVGVSFLIKLQACNFIKIRLQHSCFSVNNEKFFQNIFFYKAPPAAEQTPRVLSN